MTQMVETEAAARLRRIVMRLSRLLRRTDAGNAAQLSPTQVTVLLNVMRNGPVRLAAVGEQEGLNPTLLSRTVAGLAQAGLVDRRADDDDRRTAWLVLTEAGRELATSIRAGRTAAIEAALATLDDGEREALEAAVPALEALAEALWP